MNPPPPLFLNVDLDIESATPLRALANAFGARVFVLFSGRLNGRHALFVEITRARKGPDGIINAFCALIEGLPPQNRKQWDAACRKEFDIGLEARFASQRANRFALRAGTLQRATRLGAGIAVTFYRNDVAETPPPPSRPRGKRSKALP